ncbi:MAG: alternative ribosome rescue aminoacyl-tRNA hydrolase ArfB [Planctomycetota bacterium]
MTVPGKPNSSPEHPVYARVPETALRFESLTSMGPGGQNVNRRSTRVRLRVALRDLLIPPAARERLAGAARARIIGDHDEREVLIDSSEHRSQSRNRAACLDRLAELIEASLPAPTPRKKTKPSQGSVRRRLDTKNKRSQTKQRRRPPGADD